MRPAGDERPLPSQTPPPNSATITYNEIKAGHLTSPGKSNTWLFEAQAGERVNLVVNSQFDSYLEVYGPDEVLLASNDDSGHSLNAALFEVFVPQTGVYKIVIRGYGAATGDYALALTGGHPATSGGPLQAGEIRPLILSEQGAKWHYEGQKDTYLTITTTAPENLDTFLALYGPDGLLLITDDDSGGNLNAEIFEFQLPVNGTFTIRANTIGPSGLVTLTLSSADKVAGGGALLIGPSQSGTLRPGRVQRWTFSGEAGQVVEVSLTSADFDTFLELRDSQDNILAENDDFAGSTNSGLERFVLPANDTYTVVTRALSEAAGGEYALSLKLAKIPAGGGPLRPDTPTEAILWPGQSNRWTFAAAENTFVSLSTQSDLVDTYLELYDPQGELIAADDDSGGDLNAAVLDFPIQEAGEYAVVVRLAEPEAEGGGGYTIVLSLAENLETQGQILSGETKADSLAAGEQHSWTFEAVTDDFVTIQMKSDTLDTHLSLYNSAGTLLTLNDDFLGKQAAIVNFVIPAEGVYRVVARAYSAAEAGDYTLSLDISPETFSLEPSP
jgi:hypothetical protein